MGQQLTHRNVLLPILCEFREIMRHRIVGLDLPFSNQLHHACSRGNHLGQRRHVENRVQRHFLASWFERAISERLSVDHPPVVPHHHHGARNIAPLNGVLDDGIDHSETALGPCFACCGNWRGKSKNIERKQKDKDTNG